MADDPTITYRISADDAGSRLDSFLAARLDSWSRARLQKLIEAGDVTVNGTPSKASYKLQENDEVEAELNDEPAERFEAEDIPLEIVYEDEHLAVIDKPAGMVVHPGAGVSSGTLANAIAWHFRGGRNGDIDSAHGNRVGIVHRLDKDTSGLIVVAKDDVTHDALAKQFSERQVEKTYAALVHGVIEQRSGTIDRPIARDRWHRTKMTVAANGREALTLWRVRQRFEKFTLLDVEIKTGRTHQIRVHLASVNHPVVGDATYNEGRDNTVADRAVMQAVRQLGRFFLHAERLAFAHPRTGERMAFRSPLPPELQSLLQILNGE